MSIHELTSPPLILSPAIVPDADAASHGLPSVQARRVLWLLCQPCPAGEAHVIVAEHDRCLCLFCGKGE